MVLNEHNDKMTDNIGNFTIPGEYVDRK